MTRGVRKRGKTLEEQIAKVEGEIKTLNEQKKQLLLLKEQEDIKQLLGAAKEAGLTPAELVEKLTINKEQSERTDHIIDK